MVFSIPANPIVTILTDKQKVKIIPISKPNNFNTIIDGTRLAINTVIKIFPR